MKIDKMPEGHSRYIKRPFPIKAIQINEPFEVDTLEGSFKAKAGDYLLEGIKGELYSCDKSIFEETYECIRADVFNEVKKIIAEYTCIKDVDLKSKLRDDFSFDELDLVEMTMSLEEAFHIEIPDADADKFTDVCSIIGYIKERLK